MRNINNNEYYYKKFDLLESDALCMLRKFRLYNFNIELKNKNEKSVKRKKEGNTVYEVNRENDENLIENSLLIKTNLLEAKIENNYSIDCNYISKHQSIAEKSSIEAKNTLNATKSSRHSFCTLNSRKSSTSLIHVKRSFSSCRSISFSRKNKLKICRLEKQKRDMMIFQDEAELYFHKLNKINANLVLLVETKKSFEKKRLFVDQTILSLASERFKSEINSAKMLNSKRILIEIFEYENEDVIEMLKFIYPQFSSAISCKFSLIFHEFYSSFRVCIVLFKII